MAACISIFYVIYTGMFNTENDSSSIVTAAGGLDQKTFLIWLLVISALFISIETFYEVLSKKNYPKRDVFVRATLFFPFLFASK
jgi:hypothetical protein